MSTRKNVTTPSTQTAQESSWDIAPRLSDRAGNVNHACQDSDAVNLLKNTDGLLLTLQNQMFSEMTFIAMKDGVFGVLYEAEYFSKESEAGEGSPSDEFYEALQPHDVVVSGLLTGVQALSAQYPGVDFAIPDKDITARGRPVAWAFVRDGLLTPERRASLGEALSSF